MRIQNPSFQNLHFVQSHIFNEKIIKLEQKVRIFMHFLTYVRFVIHVYFLTNIALSLATYLPTRGLPWLHIEKWAFLYYQHSLFHECNTTVSFHNHNFRISLKSLQIHWFDKFCHNALPSVHVGCWNSNWPIYDIWPSRHVTRSLPLFFGKPSGKDILPIHYLISSSLPMNLGHFVLMVVLKYSRAWGWTICVLHR